MAERIILREDIYPGNQAAFDALSAFIAVGDIVAFTGAGVSVPRFPTWTSLLSRLIEQQLKMD